MSLRDDIVRVAREQIGKDYDTRPSYPWYGPASDYDSFNCSGLARAVYAECGIEIPSFQRASLGDSQSQWVMDNGNWSWDTDGLREGDLVFWSEEYGDDGWDWTETYHVGIYVGDDMCVSANGPRMGVAEHSVYIDSGFVGGGWPLGEKYDEEQPPQEQDTIDIKEIDVDDWAIVAFGGTGYLYAGGKLHPLYSGADKPEGEQSFVEWVYKTAKEQRDNGEMPHIAFAGDGEGMYQTGPWGDVLADILSR
jgi:hypothetical protein